MKGIRIKENGMMNFKSPNLRRLAAIAGFWAITGSASADIASVPAVDSLDHLPVISWQGPCDDKRGELRIWLAGLTPEQRQQMRQQMRDHWRQTSSDDRREQRQRWQEDRRDPPRGQEGWYPNERGREGGREGRGSSRRDRD